MSFSFSDFSAALKAGAPVTADDVLALRRWVWPDGVVSTSEAEALFALNRLVQGASPEWDLLFVEAISEHVLNACEPHLYVDEPTAAWLIEEIERGGTPARANEIELVVKILEKALNAPESLRIWALRAVEAAVVADGTIGDAEVQLLRRLVFARGGGDALVVGDAEAEMVWRLKEATLQADNAPAWKTFFVQALGNHLMAWSNYHALDRGEAAHLESVMNDHHSSVLGFFGRMNRLDLAGAAQALRGDDVPAAEHEAEVAAAQAVTPAEQGWLQSHIAADGARDGYEEALLAFVAAESGQKLKQS